MGLSAGLRPEDPHAQLLLESMRVPFRVRHRMEGVAIGISGQEITVRII